MKRLPYLLLISLHLWFVTPGYGQSKAEKTALEFFTNRQSEGRLPPGFHFEKAIREGNIWIFESTLPEGFVLVREGNPCEIAGYSTGNRFTREKRIPEPALVLLESLSAFSGETGTSQRLKTMSVPVGPLIRTHWSQEGYFNYYCPEDPRGPDNHVYVGCAAVAMGQIIRYYGKFNDFNLTVTTMDRNYGALTATLGGHDWNRMENRPIVTDLEVSEFLYGLGVLTSMGFGPTGSSTSNFAVYDGFKKLKYFSAIRMSRSSTTPEKWLDNFYQDITAYQPVYVSGSGHSFICDGIDAEGMFHFNLGWYGYGDGYYPLNQIFTLNPSEAIFDLEPYSNNIPPANLSLDNENGQKILNWERHRLAVIDPLLYRVYINDSVRFETRETHFNTAYLPPGNHELMVTAVYPQGESHWIGPIPLEVQSNPIPIPDPVLKTAILEELIRENILPIQDPPVLNQLLRLQKLEIRQPVSSLAGLEYCHNIQELKIGSDHPIQLDLGPVSLLKRLKWLELKNIESNTLALISGNERVFHLALNNCPLADMTFLTKFTNLLSLTISDVPIPENIQFSQLSSLRELTLSGCNLSAGGFIQELPELEYLDLSRNQLQRIRPVNKLPNLHDLNLSENQINELFFLEFIPNIHRLNLGYNKITRFITGVDFKDLRELNLENNAMDSIWIGIPMNSLSRLSINNNKVRNISRLKDFAPSLSFLDLSGNLLTKFWQGNLQKLEFLDLSNNRIDLTDPLADCPALRHVNISSNLISDLFPIFDHAGSDLYNFLDVSGNPLSGESVEEYVPFLQTVIDTLLLPLEAEEFSPDHPSPSRNSTVTGRSTDLVWRSESLPGNGYYQIFTGHSPENLTLADNTKENRWHLNLTPGQNYYWRIRTVLPDTSFLSGLYRFGFYQPVALPYREDFENYPSFTYLTEQSPCWMRAENDSTSATDGRIDPYRRFEGKQSLKLINATDLRLPLSHLYQTTLYITMQLLIPNGSIASVRLNDLNGAGLELFFKSNGKCTIFLNNLMQSEIAYPTSEWFSLRFNLYSKGNDIGLTIGSAYVPINWLFTGKHTHVGELELAPVAGPVWPTDGQPLFYVDKLEISATGVLGTEPTSIRQTAQVFPNPAHQFVYIEFSHGVEHPEVQLMDLSGRTVLEDLIQEKPGLWKMSIQDLNPGIYLIRINRDGVYESAKLVVIR